ncbi:hypothetical protein ACFQU2_40075 [Siccirubricoccus deserti]
MTAEVGVLAKLIGARNDDNVDILEPVGPCMPRKNSNSIGNVAQNGVDEGKVSGIQTRLPVQIGRRPGAVQSHVDVLAEDSNLRHILILRSPDSAARKTLLSLGGRSPGRQCRMELAPYAHTLSRGKARNALVPSTKQLT